MATEPIPPPLYRFLTHGLRSPLAAMADLLQQGLRHPEESASHPRYEKVLQQSHQLLQRLDAFNQTLLPPPGHGALQETLLENLLHNACDRVRPHAAARQQVLQLLAPARCAFVPVHSQCLVQAITATLHWTLLQAPQGATITLHCTLHPQAGLLHIGYSAPQNPTLPSGNITHTLYLPTLVYD